MSLQNSKKKRVFYLVSFVSVILGIAAFFIIRTRGHVTTDDAYVTGRIHSIAAKIYGTVKEVQVDDNQAVRKGDLLVGIDPIDFELKLNEAHANLDVRKATFEQASRDKKRADLLYKEQVISKEQHEKIDTAYNLAAAHVEEARAQLGIARRNLEYTKIYAPVEGYVTNKSVEIGNQIQPDQPLMAVVPLDDIWVVANYKETQLKNVRAGQRVLIRVDTYPGRIFTGKVDSIMAGTGAVFSLFPPENALGNYVKVVQRIPVKILFDKTTDSNHVLRIGMSCIPTILTKDE